MTLIALDVGTSFIKGAVVEPESLQVKHIHRVPFPDPLPNLPPLFFEVNPEQIMAAVRGVISHLLPRAPGCSGIVMCGQMGGLILVNGRGEPLSNYISWKDQRATMSHPSGAGSHFEVMEQQLSQEERRQLGNEVRPGLPVSFLSWFAEQKRSIPSKAIAAALTDFVVANLCETTPQTELTNAVGSLNLETRDWHYAAFSRLGLAGVQWPVLRDLREPVGRLKIGSKTLPCYAPTGDHQCALAGALIGFEDLSLNISTGAQASLLTPRFQPGAYQTRPFFDGLFLNTVTHIPAGRSLDILLDLLCELAKAHHVALEDPWSYIAQEVAKVDDTDLNVDLAFFFSPVGQCGRIANIREGNLTIGNLFYAAFRNLAENCYTCASRLSAERTWQTLVFSGGLARKMDLLRQMIVERFQCRHRLTRSTEDTLIGLLALAMVINGIVPTVTGATEVLRRHEGEIV